jgi:hypothetical protein
MYTAGPNQGSMNGSKQTNKTNQTKIKNKNKLPLVNGIIPLVNGVIPLINGVIPLVNGIIPLVKGIIPLVNGIMPLVNGVIPLVNGIIIFDLFLFFIFVWFVLLVCLEPFMLPFLYDKKGYLEYEMRTEHN